VSPSLVQATTSCLAYGPVHLALPIEQLNFQGYTDTDPLKWYRALEENMVSTSRVLVPPHWLLKEAGQ